MGLFGSNHPTLEAADRVLRVALEALLLCS